jgi:tRNA threonylcarbamoyladenosine biosynthesis protein TsaB
MLREGEFAVGPPEHLVGELTALAEDLLVVGDGAILYRREIGEMGSQVEFASPMWAHPQAAALVELSVPRFVREEHDRLAEVVPLYLRKSDAEINLDRGLRTGE